MPTVAAIVMVLLSAAHVADAQTASRPTFSQVVVGTSNTCALDAGGQAWCWGDNAFGQLGDGTKKQRLVPAPVSGGIAFTQILLTGRDSVKEIGLFSCGLAADGSAYCWGNNDLGQLGDGTKTDRLVPTRVTGGVIFSELKAGAATVCGISRDARLYCWGPLGAVAMGVRTGRQSVLAVEKPTEIMLPASTKPARLIADGLGDPCVMGDDGAAYCWLEQNGRLAVSVVTPPGRAFQTVLLGGLTRKCGISVDGALRCWIQRSGTMELSLEAMSGRQPLTAGATYEEENLGPGTRFTQLDQNDGMCALSTGGHVFCVSGTDMSAARTPLLQREAETLTFSTIWVSSRRCGLTTSGELHCWIGDQPPSRLAGTLTFKMLSPEGNNTCGVSQDGVIYCWGSNRQGQLGDGTRKERQAPAPIKLP